MLLRAWDACSAGTTCETRAPSASVNRLCSAVNVCGDGQHMKVAPTLAHDACGTCASNTNCTDAQYESVSETATSDRECALKEWLCFGVAGLVDIVNGEKRNDIKKLTVESFVPLGIKELLTVQRQNGLGELINRILRIANN